VPSNTRRILSASQAGGRGVALEAGWDEEEEEPEKACQNALPRRCTSVCEAIVASAACCGVGNDDDEEEEEDVAPRLGEEGGVGYVCEKGDGGVWNFPLRREETVVEGVEGLRMAAAEEK